MAVFSAFCFLLLTVNVWVFKKFWFNTYLVGHGHICLVTCCSKERHPAWPERDVEFTGAGGAIHPRRYRHHDKCEGDVSYKVSKGRDNGMFLYSSCIQSVWLLKALYNVRSGTNSTSLGSILTTKQLRANIIKSHFHHCLQPGSHLYSWVNWGFVDRIKLPQLRNRSKGDSNPGSLNCEFGILPVSYRAPHEY